MTPTTRRVSRREFLNVLGSAALLGAAAASGYVGGRAGSNPPEKSETLQPARQQSLVQQMRFRQEGWTLRVHVPRSAIPAGCELRIRVRDATKQTNALSLPAGHPKASGANPEIPTILGTDRFRIESDHQVLPMRKDIQALIHAVDGLPKEIEFSLATNTAPSKNGSG